MSKATIDTTPEKKFDAEAFAMNVARAMESGGKALAAYLKPREGGEVKDKPPEEVAEVIKTLSAVAEYWLSDNQRASDIQGELLMIWGRQDPHVPLEGRTTILARLNEVNANVTWLEVNGQHAFLRDGAPRYDPELADQCLGMALSLFHRRLAL